MNRLLSYVKSEPSARGLARSFHAAVLLILAGLAIGCATDPVYLTRTEIQRVPTPVVLPVPEELIEPLVVPELSEDLSNRDLEADIQALEAVIDKAQDDRRALRERQESTDEP